MKHNFLISIIVPIYNSEDYLPLCIKSILKQTYENLEIILVDDGSTDKSKEICDFFSQQDQRIIVIHKANGGSTSARKAGMAVATGQYISFVDSDDWIDQKMIEHFADCLDRSEADIITGGMIWELEKENDTVLEKNELAEGYYDKQQLKQKFYTQMLYYGYIAGHYKFGILQYLCGKLFKRKVIEAALSELDEDIWMGEDVACLFTACLEADSVFVDNSFFYHYRRGHETSVCSKTYRADHLTNAISLYTYMEASFKKTESSYDLLNQLKHYIFMMINMLTSAIFHYEFIAGIEWKLPYLLIEENPSVILYGAGDVGKSFYFQIKRLNNAVLVGWVDKKFEKYQKAGLNVDKPTIILERQYDMVLIAVEKEEVVKKIIEDLKELGVDISKVFWIPTERVFNSYCLESK